MDKMFHDAWVILVFIIFKSAAVDPPQIGIIPSYNTEPLWKTALTLVCKTQGWTTSPVFFWKRDGETLYPYQDPDLVFSNNKKTIYFKDLSREDSGSYSCVAIDFTQYVFEMSLPVSIEVLEPPLVPSNFRVKYIDAKSVSLTWELGGEVEAETYKVVQYPQENTFRTTSNEITINNLIPYTIYSFTVSAVNVAGSRGITNHLQIRTDASQPEGELSFTIGTRTSDSLELRWDKPTPESAGSEVQTYIIEVYKGGDLIELYNLTAMENEYRVMGLSPETQYILRMYYTTQCCVSTKSSKYGDTVAKGVTVPPPPINPVTDGNKAPEQNTKTGIIGITLGVLVFLIIAISIVAILCYRKKRRDDFTRKAPRMHRWNDGTQECRDDLVPVSPPPQYTRDPPSPPPNAPAEPLPLNSNIPDIISQEPSDAGSTVNSSVPAQNASLSRSFCYNPQSSPPPAYCSRSFSSDNNSTISTLSNVNGGDVTELLRNLGVPVEKEQNVPLTDDDQGDTWI